MRPRPTNEMESVMPYVVMVDDNFHYMDPEERYRSGEFADD